MQEFSLRLLLFIICVTLLSKNMAALGQEFNTCGKKNTHPAQENMLSQYTKKQSQQWDSGRKPEVFLLSLTSCLCIGVNAERS